MNPERVNVCGLPIDCVDMQSAVSYVDKVIQGGRKSTIFAVNPEKVIACDKNNQLKKILSSAGLLIPDGIGVVVAAKLQGRKGIKRVPGCELAVELCNLASKQGYGVFLFGAKEETNLKASEKLVKSNQSLVISGRRNGYFTEADELEIVNEINSSGAKIVLVALGSPKQEVWMNKYQGQLNANILQGVGGTFDVIAGNVKRAPKMWRATHLEWLYRLLSQPSRLFRQKALPAFVWRVITEKIRS